jgi:hypothetical protein
MKRYSYDFEMDSMEPDNNGHWFWHKDVAELESLCREMVKKLKDIRYWEDEKGTCAYDLNNLISRAEEVLK